MVRTTTHKLIFRTDPTAEDHYSELYDLKADPLEMYNVYNNNTYQAIREQLKTKLFQWYMQTSDVTPWTVDSRNNEPNKPSSGRLPYDVAHDTAPYAGIEAFSYIGK